MIITITSYLTLDFMMSRDLITIVSGSIIKRSRAYDNERSTESSSKS
jgi:hypothetical protein